MPIRANACQQDKPTPPPRLIQAGHAALPKLLRYVDAANQMSVSLNHLRGLIDAGHLTSIKVGHRARRVLAAEVDAFIQRGI
jgi:excisionase family DNA binding protein